MKHIMKCGICGKYTMNTSCCNAQCAMAVPPKYSPGDKYAGYRRKAKMEQFRVRGLI